MLAKSFRCSHLFEKVIRSDYLAVRAKSSMDLQMSTKQNELADIQQVLEVLRSFSSMLSSGDWALNLSRKEIQDCMVSATEIEKIFEVVSSNGVHGQFKSLLSDTEFNFDHLCKACDIVLRKVLTTPAFPYSQVKYFLADYLELCGCDRFETVVCSTIFQSEVYRVILDYVASAGNKQILGVSLQAQILSQMWKYETSFNFWPRWIEEDKAGHNMAVVLRIIGCDSPDNSLNIHLVSILVSALEERNEVAVLFCKTILGDLTLLKGLRKSETLLCTSLDFLRVSGHWMEATSTMSWISKETGPCQELGFAVTVSVLKRFLAAGEPISQKTQEFLNVRRNSPGCTLWDDICMKVDNFSLNSNW